MRASTFLVLSFALARAWLPIGGASTRGRAASRRRARRAGRPTRGGAADEPRPDPATLPRRRCCPASTARPLPGSCSSPSSRRPTSSARSRSARTTARRSGGSGDRGRRGRGRAAAPGRQVFVPASRSARARPAARALAGGGGGGAADGVVLPARDRPGPRVARRGPARAAARPGRCSRCDRAWRTSLRPRPAARVGAAAARAAPPRARRRCSAPAARAAFAARSPRCPSGCSPRRPRRCASACASGASRCSRRAGGSMRPAPTLARPCLSPRARPTRVAIQAARVARSRVPRARLRAHLVEAPASGRVDGRACAPRWTRRREDLGRRGVRPVWLSWSKSQTAEFPLPGADGTNAAGEELDCAITAPSSQGSF